VAVFVVVGDRAAKPELAATDLASIDFEVRLGR
jgi:hypothetical protein